MNKHGETRDIISENVDWGNKLKHVGWWAADLFKDGYMRSLKSSRVSVDFFICRKRRSARTPSGAYLTFSPRAIVEIRINFGESKLVISLPVKGRHAMCSMKIEEKSAWELFRSVAPLFSLPKLLNVLHVFFYVNVMFSPFMVGIVWRGRGTNIIWTNFNWKRKRRRPWFDINPKRCVLVFFASLMEFPKNRSERSPFCGSRILFLTSFCVTPHISRNNLVPIFRSQGAFCNYS